MRLTKFTVFLLLLSLILQGCFWPKRKNDLDGYPRRTPNLRRIKNPVPKFEPKSKMGNPLSYKVKGKRYKVMRSARNFRQKGIASFYGTKFHGRRTSNGEVYDMFKMTAAHKSLPLPTYVLVKNLENKRQIIVRINDRGPFIPDRIIDLSYVAAYKLGMARQGTAKVEIRAISPSRFNLTKPLTTLANVVSLSSSTDKK